MVDANGLPINLVLSEGQAYDGHSAHLMLDSLMPGSILLADRAYDADKLRAAITDRGAFANIPPMPPTPPEIRVQSIALSISQPDRTILQQTQTFQSRRHPIRQARRQLPRLRPARLHQDLVAS